jgi:peptidoglycan hydrolase-like amidase
MSRRTFAIAAVTALITLAAALAGMPALATASSCSGWTSSTTPPPTIRVFRHASGAVDTVKFKRYTKNVLSREWISSWSTASLRAGALTTKHYAWYRVLHWRGGTNADGACYDIRDDVADQVYDPSKPIYEAARAAVNATWGTRVLKNGNIFPTYYNAGESGESCGANATGTKLYQWGSQACGMAGKSARRIIRTYYYPGVTVIDLPPPSPTPIPSPTPTPSPTPDN